MKRKIQIGLDFKITKHDDPFNIFALGSKMSVHGPEHCVRTRSDSEKYLYLLLKDSGSLVGCQELDVVLVVKINLYKSLCAFSFSLYLPCTDWIWWLYWLALGCLLCVLNLITLIIYD